MTKYDHWAVIYIYTNFKLQVEQFLHLIGCNFFFFFLFSSFVLLFGLVSSASDTLTTCLAPPLFSNGKLTQLLPPSHQPFLFVPSSSTRLSSFPIGIPPFSLNQFPSTNSTATSTDVALSGTFYTPFSTVCSVYLGFQRL